MAKENVIIIGGGPAGLSASIYAARAGLNPLVIAGSPPGGQLTLTTEVENYPGYESIMGPDLILKMRAHALKFGVRIIDENVIKVKFANGSHKSHLTHLTNKSYESHSVIIATGAKALWLNLPSETRLRGKGVSACATCDGFFFRGKPVAVVGGGDTALEEALTLTKFAEKVYIIHRRHEFRASKIMQERALSNKKIEVIWDSAVEEVVGENKVEGINIKILDPRSQILDKNKEIHHLSSNIYHLKLDGVFIAIGHKPDTDIFKNHIELDKKGYIMTSAKKAIDNSKFLINLISNKVPKSKTQKNNELGIGNSLGQLDQLVIRNYNLDFQTMTSVSGVFAGGDCCDHVYRQAATSVGMGVAAALDAERWLNSQ